MNRKGLTLIEMLIVIVFISIVALMAIPAMTSFVKKGEDDRYKAFLSDVYLATEAYVQKYSDDYPELNTTGGIAYVYMSELVNEKLIKSNIVNPKYCYNENNCVSKRISTCGDENNCVVDDYTIIVTKEDDGTYSYDLENEILTEGD